MLFFLNVWNSGNKCLSLEIVVFVDLFNSLRVASIPKAKLHNEVYIYFRYFDLDLNLNSSHTQSGQNRPDNFGNIFLTKSFGKYLKEKC